MYKSQIIRVGERKFYVIFALGAKVPGDESSTYGTFAPGSESTWERKFHSSALCMHHSSLDYKCTRIRCYVVLFCLIHYSSSLTPASKQSNSDADVSLCTGFKSFITITNVRKQKLQGTKVPGNFRSWECKFSGTKVPQCPAASDYIRSTVANTIFNPDPKRNAML